MHRAPQSAGHRGRAGTLGLHAHLHEGKDLQGGLHAPHPHGGEAHAPGALVHDGVEVVQAWRRAGSRTRAKVAQVIEERLALVLIRPLELLLGAKCPFVGKVLPFGVDADVIVFAMKDVSREIVVLGSMAGRSFPPVPIAMSLETERAHGLNG